MIILKVKFENIDYNLDRIFQKPLDTICYNIDDGWDFIILITGSGLTRTGKSTFAQQIAAYCSKQLGTTFNNDNVVFGGKQLIDVAKRLPKKSVIIDDESREDVSGKRAMEYMNKELLDFFNECGMYNHLIILVATDFFDFSKSIAVTRSEMLFNLTRIVSDPITLKDGREVVKLQRGHIDFFDRKAKRKLYIFGKKSADDYEISAKYRSFYGHFTDTWIIDREKYNTAKINYIERDRSQKRNAWRILARVIRNLMNAGYKAGKIAKLCEISINWQEKILREYPQKKTEIESETKSTAEDTLENDS